MVAATASRTTPNTLPAPITGAATSAAGAIIVAWRASGSFALAVAACRELGLSADETLDCVAWWRGRGAYNDDKIVLNLA